MRENIIVFVVHFMENVRTKLKTTLLLYLINGHQAPDEERLVCEGAALGELLVQLGVGHGDLSRDVLVQNQGEHGQHRVHGRIPNHQEPLQRREDLSQNKMFNLTMQDILLEL